MCLNTQKKNQYTPFWEWFILFECSIQLSSVLLNNFINQLKLVWVHQKTYIVPILTFYFDQKTKIFELNIVHT